MASGGYVVLTLRFGREGKKWVGTCLELGTSTYARTLGQTEKSLDKLIIEHMNLLEEAGEREQFFQEWGIQVHKTRPDTPEFVIRDRAPTLPEEEPAYYGPRTFPVPA